ncbi:hypothetical protein MD484_g8319, partial [Candolleomyces efflorescens]
MEDEEGSRGRTRRRKPDVRIDTKPSIITADSGESSSSSTWKLEFKVPSRFKWIQDNLNWSSLKPVIRCSLAAWLATVLFAIPRVEQWMGMASFIILIASFLSPPSDPFVAVMERELLILFFSCLAWAWSCLGIKLASLSRSHIDYSVAFADVIRGGYIEAAPSVIIGVFIGVGSTFFLFIKARLGPDITLTTAVFFPFPYYTTGQSIVVPLAIHSALALTLSLLVFPLTLSASYTTRLQAVLTPLSSVLEQHITLLQSPTGTPEFEKLVEDVITTVKKSEGGLLGVAATGRLLPNDLTVSRFSPTDFQAFQGFARRITGRVQGMGMYFNLIDPTKSRFPSTPGTSVAPTPTPGTPTTPRSRQESVERGEKRAEESQVPTPKSSRAISPRGSPRDSPTLSSSHLQKSPTRDHHHHHTHFHLPHHILHQSLTNLSLRRRRRAEHVVGVFESQKYLNLEAKLLRDPRQEEWIQMETELLSEGCVPLLEECSKGIKTVDSWLDHVRHGRFNSCLGRTKKENHRARLVEQVVEVQSTLSAALSEFREHGRLRVIEPYHPVVAELGDEESGHHELPPHRHLFHCYVYQYHLIQTASVILEMLEEVLKLEEKRTKVRFWAPVTHIFRWGPHDVPENAAHDDDDDPDVIQGLHPVNSVEDDSDLGLPEKRDPDALPPRNALEHVLNTVYHALNSVTAGNSLFAVKAGLISARVIATFAGGLVGMVMWYISAGNGRASPYGLAAVCGVCFPFFFMVRLYCPIPPMTNIVAFVTAILVLGYSYQATHGFVPGSQGVGWDVAWRRFVLVTIGVVAALYPRFDATPQYDSPSIPTFFTVNDLHGAWDDLLFDHYVCDVYAEDAREDAADYIESCSYESQVEQV